MSGPRGPCGLISVPCVHDREEALTLTLQGATARNICIAVAGRQDLTLIATESGVGMCDLGPRLSLGGDGFPDMRESWVWGALRGSLVLGRPYSFVSPCSGPWWRPTCGRSVVWNSSCGSNKASGTPPSPAPAPRLPLPHRVLIWTCTTWH